MFWTPFAFAQNPIQIENARQGTASWQATNLADNSTGYTNVIEGYASLTSVNLGGQITFYVNVATPGHSFTMDFFRMGWYGGLGARKILSIGPLPGVQQTIPAPASSTGLIECNWSPSYTLTLDSTTDPVGNWVSGVYTVLLTDTTSGLQRYIVFVVRDDSRFSNYFFQSSVNTYQAYNNWGGKSLYAFDSASSSPAVKVSFNRPYQLSYGYEGTGDFLTGWEYDAVRFLEREGYDVTYGTDIDAHENASLLLNHHAIMIVGHNEYWSMAMRQNIIAARDAGLGLGLLAGDLCYWQVRFEPSTFNGAADRTMVGYKNFATSRKSPGPDPYYTACQHGTTGDCSLVTVRWRDSPVSMPENSFLGIMWANDPVNGDIKVTNSSNWIYNTTGFHDNDTLPGLLGYEVDAIYNNGLSPSGLVTLAASPYTTTDGLSSGVANSTVYTAASGSTVFTAGTFQFSWGLDDYSRLYAGQSSLVSFGVRQMTRNLLARLIGDQPPLANPGGAYTGATIQPVQFDGTGSTDPDGTVDAYAWDFGDGTTGISAQPTHAYAIAGTYTVSLIVTDSEGSRNAANTTATITDLPFASVSPAALDFSNQLVGVASNSVAVTLTNTGTADLNVASVGISSDFSQTNNCVGTLGAGVFCNILVKFTPTTTGLRSGTLTVTDNDTGAGGSTQTVTLSGTGTLPLAGVSPTSLSFGNQLVSTPSSTQPVMLSNSGSAPLTIASITASGDFSQSNNCGISVGPGNNCTINVKFAPQVTGPRTGTITITDNDSAVDGSTQTVTLSGTGTAPLAGVSPGSLTFSNQLIGTSSATKAISLSNTGTAPLTVSSIAASGNFSQTNDCSANVAVNSSCTITVTFTPMAAGIRTGTIILTDNDQSITGNTQTVNLSGTGIAPVASLGPTSLDFGNQLVGTATAPLYAILSNTGSAALSITDIAASGDYSQTNDCGTSLDAGNGCTITVTFAPTATGARPGSITITDNSNVVNGSTQVVTLSGSGGISPPSLSTSALNFGSQFLGAPSAARIVAITNTASFGLTFYSFAISGDFAIAGSVTTCSTSSPLAPSATCNIGLVFNPAASGPRRAAMLITDNAAGSPQRVIATGVGTTASLSPQALTFTGQTVGTASAPQQVILSNLGGTVMNIWQVAAAGANAADFSFSGACTNALGPGASCILNISFMPGAEGARAAVLMVSDDGGSSPQMVSLAGTGLAPPSSPSQATSSTSTTIPAANNSTGAASSISAAGGGTEQSSAGTPASPTGTSGAAPGSSGITISAVSTTSSGEWTRARPRGSPTGALANSNPAALQVSDTSSGVDWTADVAKIPVTNPSAENSRLSPAILFFGNQEVGGVSQARSVTISNSGTSAIAMEETQILEGEVKDFSLSGDCGTVLQPGTSCTLRIVFTPRAEGGRAAVISIQGNSPGFPLQLRVEGTGINSKNARMHGRHGQANSAFKLSR